MMVAPASRSQLSLRTEYAYRLVISAQLKVLRSLTGGGALSLDGWRGLQAVMHQLIPYVDPLMPAQRPQTGASLRTARLRTLLLDDELGTWALDTESIELLWRRAQDEHPSVIVEFGAGASSLVLGAYARARREQSGQAPLVLSFEQDSSVKERVEQRLQTADLSGTVQILPLAMEVDGRYSLDAEQVRRVLGGRSIDWVLIDGPAGPDGCRVETLPLLATFCRPGTRWFLDDALRDGEIQALRQWHYSAGVCVEGIIPVGKGLAIGEVGDPTLLTKVGRR